jgi:membrane protein YqaA with SNARE-associated domain
MSQASENTQESAENSGVDAVQTPKKRGVMRKLYDWTIHWADTRYALAALIIISFAESSFFPIPPDVLLLAMCFAKPKKWALYAFWCTAASAAGGVFGWYIGWGLYETVGVPIVKFYQGEAFIEAARDLYSRWGDAAVLVAAITPIPYKIFTIISGVLDYDPVRLFVLSLLGRGLRFFAVALLIRLFGKTIRTFLEKHFEWASIVFVLLGILGFVALKFLKSPPAM